MRRPRLKAPEHHDKAFYHCVSRVVNREFVLLEEEKEQFVAFMRTYEQLYGLRILTYCIMSNHFHILVEVPKRPEEAHLPDDKALVAHVRKHLGDSSADSLAWDLEHFRSQKNDQSAEELRQKWFSRMWDISPFMKILKQRFTQWFNKKHGRRGTLWEDRFRSVLIQGESHGLKATAAYIELNPVRAKICDDPKDYRWSGYGEAIGKCRSRKSKKTRAAISYLASISSQGGFKVEQQRAKNDQQALEIWRCFLFGLPEDTPFHKKRLQAKTKKGSSPTPSAPVHYRRKISHQKALEVLQSGGKLPPSEYLRCKIRYFSDGVAIGGKSFVEDIFTSHRERFGEKRKQGSQMVKGLDSTKSGQTLYNLRNLQKEVFS